MGLMGRRRSDKQQERPLSWLPIDSRLMHSLISFGTVRGIAKVFLAIEMLLAVFVVLGTFALFLIQVFIR